MCSIVASSHMFVTPQCVHLVPFDNKVNCSSQVAVSHEEDHPAGPSYVLASLSRRIKEVTKSLICHDGHKIVPFTLENFIVPHKIGVYSP